MKLLLSFVLGFNYFEIPDAVASPEDDDENTSTHRSFSTRNEDSLDISEEIGNENIVKPKEYLKQICKIQYDLPKIGSKNITVVYLGTCAKITLDNTSIFVKCKILGLTSFISFTVLHQFDTSDINAPVSIKHHDIHFFFKSEWTADYDSKTVEGGDSKLYYFFPENDEGSFGYLLEIKKGKIPEKADTQYLKVDSKNYLLRTTCKFHRENTKILIQNAAEELAKIFQRINDQENETKICETDSAKKTGSLREPKTPRTSDSKMNTTFPSSISLTLSGNELLFEKSVWKMGQVSSSADIIYGGLMATSTQVLTEEQRSFYKPLSVNIKSIANLPPSLTDHRIQTLSIEYSLPPLNISEVIQPEELEKGSKLKFNDYKTFFNNEHKDEIIIETIQSASLEVTVYGHREKIIVEPESRVWGQHLSCNKFYKRFDKSIDSKDIALANTYIANEKENGGNKQLKNKKKSKKDAPKKPLSDKSEPEIEKVAIGFTSIGLYSLMQYCHKIIKNAALRSTSLARSQDVFKMAIRPLNAMHFHSSYISPQIGIISEKEFTDCVTTIKVELKLGYNLTRYVLNDVLTIPTLFARCIIIDYDPKESYKFLKELLQLNKATLVKAKNVPFNCYQNLGIVPDICSDKVPVIVNYEEDITYEIEKNTDYQVGITTNNQNYFTGFMVNVNNNCIIVLECLDIQAISKIMFHRYQMLQEKGRILYNSNFVFNERLYDDFLKFGGVFVTALGTPLESVFSNSQIAHWVPRPALKCLEILKRITKARCIHQSLFPTPLELLSMDLEFGVPLHRTDVIYN